MKYNIPTPTGSSSNSDSITDSNANSNTHSNSSSISYRDSETVSCHNFKSRNFKLSVSNPKSRYAAYLSVLSQISNCQGLGRKNKHEILKIDRRKPPTQ